MRQHESNAKKIAEHLSTHKKIGRVYYPGLKNHPQHALAARQMSGFGGILAFEIDGSEAFALRFLEQLSLFSLAVSFGSVTSLVAYPAKMSHKDMPPEERKRRGFGDTLIRFSVGIEDCDDLLEDINNALSKL